MPSVKPMSDNRKTQRSSALSKAFDSTKVTKDASIVSNPMPPTSTNTGSADFVGRETFPFNTSTIIKSPSGAASTNKLSTVSRMYGNKQQTSSSQQQAPVKFSAGTYQVAPSSPPNAIYDGDEEQHPVDMSMRAGMKFEFAFALAAASIYLGLWIFLMTVKCYQVPDMVFWVKAFSLLGTFTSLFVAVYCCFERGLAPRQGLTGCLFFTALVVVGCLNLIGAYLSIGCICKCDRNAIRDGGDDLVIMILEICGSACLLSVLLVASLSH